MNKAYFLVPLLAVVLFGGYYWSFTTAYDKELKAKEVAAQKAHEDQLALEAKNREVAIKQAIEADQKRKAERAAKEAKDKQEKEARSAAVEVRNAAQRNSNRLESQSIRLAKDVGTLKEEIAKIQEMKKSALAEQDFLNVYVKQAEANVKSLQEVLDKIDAANRAKIEYDRAQAAAKAKS
jgi:hypothetical protein